ncbi:MAG: hypothetical protein P8X52_05515, partial [Limibacillus sp.]
ERLKSAIFTVRDGFNGLLDARDSRQRVSSALFGAATALAVAGGHRVFTNVAPRVAADPGQMVPGQLFSASFPFCVEETVEAVPHGEDR